MRKWTWLLALAVFALSACTPAGTGSNQSARKIRIGLSLDTLREERWQRDRDIFVGRARELGAEVIVEAAASDDYLQRAQAENMLGRGVDVLVVVPHDATAMAPVVAKAHEKGVKVIAYDRLIKAADVDLYVSFDNETVGRLQAEYLTKLVPKGNYVYIGGSKSDNNVFFLKQGAMSVLDPFRAKGDIRVVFEAWTPEWRPENAERLMEEALAQTGGKVDAVICGNDGTAGGAVRALYRHGLAGKVPVAGQDADLQAVRRIVQGTQAMTVYKPIRELATRAAEVAVAMAKGETPVTNATVNNDRGDVPAYLLQPIRVDRSNLRETVIRDGFHREEDVFVNE
ncbi:MAG TPA: D-xylose ABC transporter substrate-binding protein [Symbiobacteriaceae bacterium]|nr:D-xylose ABC transporter substrate-binding protein [Symbiobacteriaceae bacterium]